MGALAGTTGAELGHGLSVGLKGYYDLDEVEDLYANFGVNYGLDINKQFDLKLGALAGYAEENASEGTDDGLHEYQFSVSASYNLNRELNLSATLAYVDSFDDDVLSEQDRDLYGGIGLQLTL